MFLVSALSCLCAIYWNQVLSGEGRCSWSSAGRGCPNYIWVINNLIAYQSANYIRDLTVMYFHVVLCIQRVWQKKSPYYLKFCINQYDDVSLLIRPSDANYMHQWSGLSLVLFHIFGTKPWPKPMLNCQCDRNKQNSLKFRSKCIFKEEAFEINVCKFPAIFFRHQGVKYDVWLQGPFHQQKLT